MQRRRQGSVFTARPCSGPFPAAVHLTASLRVASLVLIAVLASAPGAAADEAVVAPSAPAPAAVTSPDTVGQPPADTADRPPTDAPQPDPSDAPVSEPPVAATPTPLGPAAAVTGADSDATPSSPTTAADAQCAPPEPADGCPTGSDASLPVAGPDRSDQGGQATSESPAAPAERGIDTALLVTPSVTPAPPRTAAATPAQPLAARPPPPASMPQTTPEAAPIGVPGAPDRPGGRSAHEMRNDGLALLTPALIPVDSRAVPAGVLLAASRRNQHSHAGGRDAARDRSPHSPSPPSPPAPGGAGAASGASAASGGVGIMAALIAALGILALPAACLGRALTADAHWRSAAVVSAIERPG
jgi:hypothetical protein